MENNNNPLMSLMLMNSNGNGVGGNAGNVPPNNRPIGGQNCNPTNNSNNSNASSAFGYQNQQQQQGVLNNMMNQMNNTNNGLNNGGNMNNNMGMNNGGGNVNGPAAPFNNGGGIGSNPMTMNNVNNSSNNNNNMNSAPPGSAQAMMMLMMNSQGNNNNNNKINNVGNFNNMANQFNPNANVSNDNRIMSSLQNNTNNTMPTGSMFLQHAMGEQGQGSNNTNNNMNNNMNNMNNMGANNNPNSNFDVNFNNTNQNMNFNHMNINNQGNNSSSNNNNNNNNNNMQALNFMNNNMANFNNLNQNNNMHPNNLNMNQNNSNMNNMAPNNFNTNQNSNSRNNGNNMTMNQFNNNNNTMFPPHPNSSNNCGNNNSNEGSWAGTISVPIKTGQPVNYMTSQQVRQAMSNPNANSNNNFGRGVGGRGEESSGGGGGGGSDLQRASSEPLLNAMFGNDGGNNFSNDNGMGNAQFQFPAMQQQQSYSHNHNEKTKNDLLRLLCDDLDNDEAPEEGFYGNGDTSSKPRRSSEPAISVIDDIFGPGGLDDSQNDGSGRDNGDGWASFPTTHSPEPGIDPPPNMKGGGNPNRRFQRHNSEPMSMDILSDVFDYDPGRHKGVSTEKSQWGRGGGHHSNKGRNNKNQGERQRSRSLDLLNTFTSEDPLSDLMGDAPNAEHDPFMDPSTGTPPYFNEGGSKTKTGKSAFAEFLASEVLESDKPSRKTVTKLKIRTKGGGSVESRRQKPKSSVKRSRSVDPVEMFSMLGNDGFDEENLSDDESPKFQSDPQDDIFNGMSPEEQQRLESLGIFSRTKPKRRRSAPLLSQDFLGDLDGLDADDNECNESFATFPDALLDDDDDEDATPLQHNINNATGTGPTDSQKNSSLHLLQMLLGPESAEGGDDCVAANSPADNTAGNSMFMNQLNNMNNAGPARMPEIPQSNNLNKGQVPFVRQSGSSQAVVQRFPTKTHELRPISSLQQPRPMQKQQLANNNFGNGGEGFYNNQAAAGFSTSGDTSFSVNAPASEEDLSIILSIVRNVQNQLRNLHPIVTQSGNAAAMEDIAKAFEITAKSSNFLLASDLENARRSLDESETIIKKLCNNLQINGGLAAPNTPPNSNVGLPQARPEIKLQMSYVSAPLPLPPASKSKKKAKATPKSKVVELEDLPPQDSSDPNVIMSRLKVLMERTQMSQKQLQKWDKKNGLPKSHSQTMVNSNRSRKQLQKGVILKKWNGAPLIAVEGETEDKDKSAETEGETKEAVSGQSEGVAEKYDEEKPGTSLALDEGAVDGANATEGEKDIFAGSQGPDTKDIAVDKGPIHMNSGDLSESVEKTL